MSKPTKEEIIEKTIEEFELRIQETRPIVETSLFKFDKHILQLEKGKGNVPLAPVHKEICEFIDKNKKKRKLLLIPRGHLKSTVVTVGYSLQAICKNPEVRILIGNATYENASAFLTEIKRHLKFNEKIHWYWGDLSKDAQVWNVDSITLGASKKKEPTVRCMGVGGNLTSQHYDIIILDDLVNEKNVTTADQIQKVINFYKECSNLLEPDGEMIVIGTRWHDSDLYGHIMDSENGIIGDYETFVREAHTDGLFSEDPKEPEILFKDKFTKKHLQKIYKELGPYLYACTPEETPVLMSDWTFKQIKDVKKGDSVIGFKSVNGQRRQYLPSKVLNTGTRMSQVNEITLESGDIARCTPDHLWFTGRGEQGGHRVYAEAGFNQKQIKGLQKGFKIPQECPKEKQQMAYWLGGFFDADGHITDSLCIVQSHEKHPEICQRIRDVLTCLDFDFKESPKPSRPGTSDFVINGGRDEIIRFLNWCKPIKAYQIIDRMYRRSKRLSVRDNIKKITPLGKKQVYSLETETGNYVAWGYLSKNCNYLNNPVPDDEADFKREWFIPYDPTDLRGKPLNKFITIDPAISVEKDADYTAMVTVGVDEFRNIYILDIVRARLKPKEIIDTLFDLWHMYSPVKIGIEDVAFQKSLQYALTEEMHNRYVYLPITPLRPGGRAKEQRIRGLQPLYANQKIFHSKHVRNIMVLEDELTRFPRGKNDDTADALAYILDLGIFPAKRKVTRKKNRRYLYA